MEALFRFPSNGRANSVAVLAGSVSSPVFKSVARSLEHKGYIVYCIVKSEEEERMVYNESRSDIRPFRFTQEAVSHPLFTDLLRTTSKHEPTQMNTNERAMDRFSEFLYTPQKVFAGAKPHELNFSGLVLMPDLAYPTGPIETLPSQFWCDAFNTRIIDSIILTQSFLPLLVDFKSRILLLSPSIVSSLQPAFHGVESTVIGALDSYATTLSREVKPLGVQVCQVKLGSFNHGASSAKSPATTDAAGLASASSLLGPLSVSTSSRRGSPIAELHAAVFDALTEKRPAAVRCVGRGSLVYGVVGRWAPVGLVGWMLGFRKDGWGGIAPLTDKPRLEESGLWEKVDVAGAGRSTA